LKVFVTGASGLIGSQIVRQLVADGHQVYAIRRASSSMALLVGVEDEVTWTMGDIFDTQTMYEIISDVDCVIHCAGVISENDRALMYDVNVEGTANIVNLSTEAGIRKLIHISSIAALGKTKNGKKINESTKWEDGPKNSKYGESKMLGEREVWRGMAEGLSAVILNPSIVLGLGDGKSGSSVILPLIAKGPKQYLMGGSGFVDVEDVARFAVAAMQSDIAGERYIISGYNKSFKELTSDIAVQLNVAPPVKALSQAALNLMSCLDGVASLIPGRNRKLTKTMVMQAIRTLQYDNEKSRSELDFEYTPWEDTVERLCAEYNDSQTRLK